MLCLHVQHISLVPKEVKRGRWIPWNQHYGGLRATIAGAGYQTWPLQEQALLILNHLFQVPGTQTTQPEP